MVTFNLEDSTICLIDYDNDLSTLHMAIDKAYKSIAIATLDKTIVLFDCVEFKFVDELKGHTSEINAIIYVDSKTIVSGASELCL